MKRIKLTQGKYALVDYDKRVMKLNTIIHGDALTELKKFDDACIDTCITSPPYWGLRDYGVDDQLGLEPTFEEYITKLCDIFDEVKRVLKDTGTCWVNIGDTYSATRWSDTPSTTGISKKHCDIVLEKKTDLPDKCLCGIPFRFALEMINRGWILRNTLIWYKPNCMPSSAKDRFTVDFEYLFFFVKNKKYYFEQQFEDAEPWNSAKGFSAGGLRAKFGVGIAGGEQWNSTKTHEDKWQQGRNKRCVWRIPTQSFSEAHFAVFPEKLIETPIKAGCPIGGIVLDPFIGSGTTGVVARKLGRDFIGIELNKEYIEMAHKRIMAVPESLFKESK